MIVCNHLFDQMSILDVAVALGHADHRPPLDSSKAYSVNLACHTCDAQVEVTVSVNILKPGKSRKTHRLWALLKGVA